MSETTPAAVPLRRKTRRPASPRAKFVTLQQVEELWGFSQGSIRDAVRRGNLAVYRLPGCARWYLLRSDIEALPRAERR